MPEAAALTGYFESRLPIYIDELTQFCAIDSPTSYKPGVDQAAAWVRSWIGERTWTVQRHEDPLAGESLVVTLTGGNLSGQRILLAAHLDTVYPVGIARERPVVQQGDVLLGPGTADNKSGLLSGLYAMAALEDLGLLEQIGTMTLVCGADEETDMRSSAAILRELRPSYDVALVLEAGRENGDIVAERKGRGQFVIDVFGRAAHAGVEPHRGANAILALSQQIVALQLLNGMRPGLTVNVGVIEGGTLANVVPDHARAEVDVRIASPDDIDLVYKAIANIATMPYVAGTESQLSGGWRGAPMARTPDIDALVALADSCARELGFDVAGASTGGISYANLLASLSMPVLDGLGPIGGLDHSPREYILVSSIVSRTALLALLMLRRTQQLA